MTREELTIAAVLKDPLIRQVMRADGVTVKEMRKLLHDAAGRQTRGGTAASRRGYEADF